MKLLNQKSLDLIYNKSGNNNYTAIGEIRRLIVNMGLNGERHVNMLRISRSLDPEHYELAMDILKIARSKNFGIIYDVSESLLSSEEYVKYNLKELIEKRLKNTDLI